MTATRGCRMHAIAPPDLEACLASLRSARMRRAGETIGSVAEPKRLPRVGVFMLDTFAVLTLDFAKAFGLFILVTGLSGLFAPDRWRAVMEDYVRLPGLTWLTAMMAFALGLVLVSLHSLWTDPLAIIVSLIGWIILLEGLLLMAVPEALLKLGAACVASHKASRIWAIFAVVLGAVLLASGLTGHATSSF